MHEIFCAFIRISNIGSIASKLLKEQPQDIEPPTTFADIDGRCLALPSGKKPFHRVLAVHIDSALEKARKMGWNPIAEGKELSVARADVQELLGFSLDKKAQDRIKRMLQHNAVA